MGQYDRYDKYDRIDGSTLDALATAETPAKSAAQTVAGTHSRPRHARRPSRRGEFTKFTKTPKGMVLFLLLALMLVAFLHASDRIGIRNVSVSMATAAVIDVTLAMLRKNKRILPDGGIISGLIIGLVLGGIVHWQVAALTSAIAVGSKHLFKIGRKPIFNPAGFALLLTLLVFHTAQSWWGDLADVPLYLLPLLLVGGYIITARINKFPLVFTYLGTYFLFLIIAAMMHVGNAAYTPSDAMRVPLVNASLFLAFFMLTDPPTSPAKYGEQIIFSVLAATVSVSVYLLFGGLSYLYIGLLVANAWKALWKPTKTN